MEKLQREAALMLTNGCLMLVNRWEQGGRQICCLKPPVSLSFFKNKLKLQCFNVTYRVFCLRNHPFNFALCGVYCLFGFFLKQVLTE